MINLSIQKKYNRNCRAYFYMFNVTRRQNKKYYNLEKNIKKMNSYYNTNNLLKNATKMKNNLH